jgi:hypothetical protein
MIMAESDAAKTFTDASIKRIAEAVRRSEQGNRDAQAYVGPPRMQAAAGAKVFVGTYTGDWAIGEYRTVTYTNSTNTASVKNWCFPAMGSTSPAERRTVLWSKASGTNSVLEIFTDRIFVGTYTGTWPINTSKTVTFTNSTQTATVKNWCVPATNATTGTVIWAMASGTNSVLEITQAVSTASQGSCVMTLGSVSLTALTGYLSTQIQILGHNTVPCLQWYSIATCATT